ncbi:hypothetical protein P171DRAFT_435211 [Karstenula rhodostoma CBS 690.94]|uniref:Uncharacterized protein n=1 Tax=Karstenula rhodostoma CBS 690.94 TaxID=1392251 RepID=A0A9P4PCC6_9PLEO|nr:hypothetical protein P171DRAFT_435211 [Karstenula rhodostoma CBS 690.94]
MPKHKNRESSGSSGGKPYERILRNTAKVNYSDAEILELADPGRAVHQPIEAGASEGYVTACVSLRPLTQYRLPTQAGHVTLVSSSAVNVPKAPANTWVVETSAPLTSPSCINDPNNSPRDTLTYLSKSQLLARRDALLDACTHRANLFAAAIQRFEMYAQFFASACATAHPDGQSGVLLTLRAAVHFADELFPPRRDYTVAVTLLRHFVAGVLHRLHPANETRLTNTRRFNELSHQYEDGENAIRDTMAGIGKVEGGTKAKLEVYMKAFKERGEMLKAQQARLEVLAEECLEEIEEGEGLVGI